MPALWLRALGAAQEKPTARYVHTSIALCLEIRADRQSQWSTLEALFYCCFTAEIAARSGKCLALLPPHCSSRTWPAAGGGRTLRLFAVQQQLVWMLKNWKYQQSSLYATEFPAVGLLPAKLAKFKTEFLHQPERVSWTKPTEKLVPGRQSGPLAPHPSPAGPHHQLGPTALDHFIHFPCLKVLDCTQQSWITKEHRLHLNCFKCCQEKRGLGSSPS